MDTEVAPTTIYERIGGKPAVEALVNQFYARVLTDPELAPYFRQVALDKLRHMQLEFFSAALGGPVEYTGRPIAHAHQGRGISLQHFQAFVRHLFETLKGYPLTEQERYDIITRVNTYADDVVGMVGGPY